MTDVILTVKRFSSPDVNTLFTSEQGDMVIETETLLFYGLLLNMRFSWFKAKLVKHAAQILAKLQFESV